MSDVNFYNLKKRFKSKGNIQRYNLFVDRISEKNIKNDFLLTKEKIRKTERKIDLSLRKITIANSEKIDTTLTDEAKSLQMLVRQQ